MIIGLEMCIDLILTISVDLRAVQGMRTWSVLMQTYMVAQIAGSFGVVTSLLGRADVSSVRESFDRTKHSRCVVERSGGVAKMSMMEEICYCIMIVMGILCYPAWNGFPAIAAKCKIN